MCHTKDSQFVGFQPGKFYDIWDTLSHRPLVVVLVDGGDVSDLAVAVVAVLMDKDLILLAGVVPKLLQVCC
jgi:hypothetical protein